MSIERFMIRTASLASILPAAAGAPLGALGGRALAQRFGISPETATMLGGITGATLGGLVKEKVEDAESQATPPGAPYALDPSSADIPPWALQGARMLQPALKQANEEIHRPPVSDILKGEVPGYSVVEQGLKHGPGAAARTFGGMAGGGLVGGGLGALGGFGLEKLLGHQVNVPGVGMSLPDLLASIGGTIGATKGLRYLNA